LEQRHQGRYGRPGIGTLHSDVERDSLPKFHRCLLVGQNLLLAGAFASRSIGGHSKSGSKLAALQTLARIVSPSACYCAKRLECGDLSPLFGSGDSSPGQGLGGGARVRMFDGDKSPRQSGDKSPHSKFRPALTHELSQKETKITKRQTSFWNSFVSFVSFCSEYFCLHVLPQIRFLLSCFSLNMVTQLTTLKARLGLELFDTTDDPVLTNLLRHVSARFAAECNRTFDFGSGITPFVVETMTRNQTTTTYWQKALH